jgi:hypothetical protein
MKNMISHCARAICLTAAVFLLTTPGVAQNAQRETIEGKVVGYSLEDLIEFDGIPNQQNLYVRVINQRNPGMIDDLIKIRNVYRSKHEKLPKNFFKSGKVWLFSFERTSQCDENVDWTDRRKYFLFGTLDSPATKSRLPCYTLIGRPIKSRTK